MLEKHAFYGQIRQKRFSSQPYSKSQKVEKFLPARAIKLKLSWIEVLVYRAEFTKRWALGICKFLVKNCHFASVFGRNEYFPGRKWCKKVFLRFEARVPWNLPKVPHSQPARWSSHVKLWGLQLHEIIINQFREGFSRRWNYTGAICRHSTT